MEQWNFAVSLPKCGPHKTSDMHAKSISIFRKKKQNDNKQETVPDKYAQKF
jgi:hypothetical protein